MKDRKKGQITFNDMLDIGAKNRPMKIGKQDSSGMIKPIKTGIMDKDGNAKMELDNEFDYIKVAKEYNAKVPVIDPAFSEEFQMADGLLILRMYMEVPRGADDDSVIKIVSAAPMTAVPTASGHDMKRIPKAYPYTNKGVVIASGSKEYQTGDEVIVNVSLITEQPLPGTDRTYLKSTFLHPDQNQMDLKRCVGYILCNKHEIYAKVNNKKDQGDV